MYQAYILTGVFFLLSLLHFFWALGGKWWLDNAVPKTMDGSAVINPGLIAKLVVGFTLLGFGSFYLWLTFAVSTEVTLLTRIVGWAIPTIFLLRAIGDLKYVGFFKQLTTTEFAHNDTRIYSPLCLTIAILAVNIASRL